MSACGALANEVRSSPCRHCGVTRRGFSHGVSNHGSNPSHLVASCRCMAGRCAQVVSPSTSPDVGSLISTITAVPDRARAARAGGEYSKNLHRRAPPRPTGCRRCVGLRTVLGRAHALFSLVSLSVYRELNIASGQTLQGCRVRDSVWKQCNEIRTYQIWGNANEAGIQNDRAMHRNAQPEHLSWTRRRATPCASSI